MEIKAKNRLKEVLFFWNKAASSYQNVDEFLINLNACIQACRNVTFVLQNQKSEITDFHSWYECDWRIAMSNDSIMRWCVEARNTIVKQEDLAIRSIARASIHDNYLLEPTFHIAIDPMIDLGQVANALFDKFPEREKMNGFIKVERQWRVEGLEIELLSALAHAATVLMTLIADADERNGSSSIYPEFDPKAERIDHQTIKELLEEHSPECMKQFEDYRVAWFKLPNLDYYNFKEDNANYNSKQIKIAKKKYNNNGFDLLFPKLYKSTSFLEKIEASAEIAKKMLQIDGYHIPLVILFCRSGKLELVTTQFEDQSDKYVFWHKIAKKVRRVGVKELISINEAWEYNLNDKIKYGNALLIPNKKEKLIISGISEMGHVTIIAFPFSRKENHIVFSEREIYHETPNYLIPITKIWKKNRKYRRKE
jgi:hypothetical protein